MLPVEIGCGVTKPDGSLPSRNPVQANGADERGGSFAQLKTLAQVHPRARSAPLVRASGAGGELGVGPRPIPDSSLRDTVTSEIDFGDI